VLRRPVALAPPIAAAIPLVSASGYFCPPIDASALRLPISEGFDAYYVSFGRAAPDEVLIIMLPLPLP
jgi:hypothetical protein